MSKKPQDDKKETPQKEEAVKYSKAELLQNAAAFGVKPEVMAGALYNVTEATKEETEKLIKAFLRKGVK